MMVDMADYKRVLQQTTGIGGRPRTVDVLSCSECGSLVHEDDVETHNVWHNAHPGPRETRIMV